MFNKRTLSLLPFALLAISTSGCASLAKNPPELLPVTAVPPVKYATAVPSISPVQALPTVIPFVSPTPYREQDRQQQVPEVRAGEVDDNALWGEYLQYRRSYQGPYVHDVDISERYIITALDGDNRPILDARVTIWDGQVKLWEARTFATGQTLFFPRALANSQSGSFLVSIHKDGIAQTFEMPRDQQESWVGKLEQLNRRQKEIGLDVLFLLDSTGSMSDEIEALQSSILSIADQIDDLHPRPDLRFGLVSYRDRGDDYVVTMADFTSNVRRFSEQLNQIQAQGGGDYPESLNEALHVALHTLDWREEDCVRLIFLIADAPPHLDYAQDFDYAQEMAMAAANAIKIFPIAASGSDDQAEYIFRQMAQFTQARYIFLTYEGPANGGEPGDVRPMHVDSYGVQDLDDLVVRLVREELAHQDIYQ
jgi:Mg-chelatase subunit ChlD